MSHSILYVDDDRANLAVFEAAFGDELPALTASSGDEALALLASRDDIAVLLTDQRMPGMSGTELAERVRRDHPDVIRFLVTAYADLGAAVDAINLGQVHRYLRKPWDPQELRVVLREGLAQYDTTRRLRDLERRMRDVERVYSLGVVAGSIVHELRNPMSVIAGHVELARTDLDHLAELAGPAGAALVEELRDHLATSLEAIVRMSDITRGVEMATQRRASNRATDLGEVVETTYKLVQRDLRYRAAATLTSTRGLRVAVGPTPLSQIVLNLLINALQALPPDSNPESAAIATRLRRDAGVARLEVADSGPGVPADLREKIFDPFFTTKSEGGTGLGLAISRQIVADVGGRLWVEDTPGGGATFVAELPLVD
ncbi:MAG: hybrid sensor histidine kinase/response regulator [Kofleriaceae bacterium]|nr:hybrid sensor histidine kinase/response regulator [Myxococcales bacterium]MCB9563747.1 hybrid sensor histidine kinase/response regulator [Kofleriaceae bacterium]